MALLQAAGSMTANGFWYPPLDPIYIYKITCNIAGHFYVGQTNDLKRRAYEHYIALIGEAAYTSGEDAIKFHETVGAYLKMADLHRQNKKEKTERFILNTLSITVLAIAADREASNVLEGHYIEAHISNPSCMNIRVHPYADDGHAAKSTPLNTVLRLP